MDGEIATTEQQPANAEALKEATAVLRDLCEQRGTSSTAVETAANAGGWDADDADAEDCGDGRALRVWFRWEPPLEQSDMLLQFRPPQLTPLHFA